MRFKPSELGNVQGIEGRMIHVEGVINFLLQVQSKDPHIMIRLQDEGTKTNEANTKYAVVDLYAAYYARLLDDLKLARDTRRKVGVAGVYHSLNGEAPLIPHCTGRITTNFCYL